MDVVGLAGGGCLKPAGVLVIDLLLDLLVTFQVGLQLLDEFDDLGDRALGGCGQAEPEEERYWAISFSFTPMRLS